MSVDPTWVASAAAITPGFETTGDPFVAAVGDFDGMGISCGALQWNIGMGSLQPMVTAAGRDVVRRAMPTLSDQMWSAVTQPLKQGLAIVRGWQNGTRLRAGAKAELSALMGSPEMRAQQMARINGKADTAFAMARDWTAATGATPTKRQFLWFFDLVTQNGGLKGITPVEVAAFIALNRPDRVDDLICDFLAGKTGTSGHVKDAWRNAALWRNPAGAEKLELLCLSYLRAGKSNPKWAHVVLNRKGTIAMGRGWVNSAEWSFAAHGI